MPLQQAGRQAAGREGCCGWFGSGRIRRGTREKLKLGT